MRSTPFGLSLGGCLILLPVVYAISVAFWSIFISLIFHWTGDPHSWWWTCNHWGLLAPFVLG